jgi:hypothetical protein
LNYLCKKVEIYGEPLQVTLPVSHIDSTASPVGGLLVSPPELNCNRAS